MGDLNSFKELFEAQRIENKEQFSELRTATSEMAKAVSQLTANLTRVEERHLSHDNGMKRISVVLDDHEKQLRVSEGRTNTAIGSWKALTVIGSIAAAVVSFSIGLWGKL
ncbi:hypothetical protein OA92_07280 [Marinomonas sp. SBI22]|uniref:hypothetical protein n=1 Tax=unclassified Marinomonas TaxID=196814 RepID=UPI0007AFA710|nr:MULTISPECIES: hypothetical protein [unclassified Marinomonas]KZM40416.1 hypothetical protein OA91_19480 [Marinomonas sp. SBI8L]KZM43507.1 hypothetical protein OA92_07280 [Marinomonas sp. SBI22]